MYIFFVYVPEAIKIPLFKIILILLKFWIESFKALNLVNSNSDSWISQLMS